MRILLGLDAGGVRTGGSGVRGELKGIQAEANATQSAMSRIGTSAAPAFASIQHAALDTAKTLGVAFGAFKVGEFVGEAIKAAQDEEAGIARLDASLKANVTARDGATAAIDRQIKANEDLGFADDATRDSLTGLVAATHDVNEALRVQNTAMDLARFKHISLQEASDALVKVEGGRFRLLAGLGIQLGVNATKEQALAAVQAVAAGQAQEFANTTAGSAEAAAAAFHDAEEALGTALLPLIREAAKVIKNDFAPAVHEGSDIITQFIDGGNDLAKVLNDLIALGPQFHDAIVGPRQNDAQKSGQALALKAMQDYTTALRVVDIALADGTMTQDQAAAATQAASDAYRAAIGVAGGVARANGIVTDSLKIQSDTALVAAESARDHSAGMDYAARSALALTVAVGTAAGATVEQKQAAADAKAEFDRLGTAFDGFDKKILETAPHMGVYSADLDNAAMRAIGLKANTDALAASLNGLPTDIQIAITIKETLEKADRQFKVDTAPFINPNAQPGTGDADRRFAFDPGSDPAQGQQATDAFLARDRDAKARAAAAAAAAQTAAERAAREATATAQKAAAEQAAAYRDKLSGAFDAVRHAAETYYAKLHDLNLKAIKDAHDHANALLDAQKAANLAPVNEAQAAQRAIQQQRELAQRQADLAAAQAEQVGSGSGQVAADQKAQDVLRAQQALADFNAQARIAAMQATADAANAQIDVEKAKNDTLAATATQAENDRATAQREAFANDLKALEASLSKHPETWAKTQQEILKLLMSYGVDYKRAAQDLGDQFAAGLLASTRAAEEAAAAVANAAGGKLGVIPKPVVLPAPVVPVPVIPTPVMPPPVTLAAPVIPVPVIPAPAIPPASVLHPPVVPTPIVPTLNLPPPITLPAPIVPEIPAPSPIDHDAAAAALAAWTTAQDDALALLNSRIGEFGDVGRAQGAAYAEALLGARDAAAAAGRAIASAALVALNVSPVLERTPQPVGAGAGAASAAVADSLGEGIVIENHTHVYLDGEQITEDVERRMAARYSRVGSGIGG